MHLAISIKMHKRAYWGCTKRYTWGCTWVAPVIALVDTIINANGLSNGSSNGGPNSPLENALDAGLNVGLGLDTIDFLLKAFKDAQWTGKRDALDVLLDDICT